MTALVVIGEIVGRNPTFGVCALGLAAIGLYGLVTHWVQQRSREIGVRLALGADGSRIAAMVVH